MATIAGSVFAIYMGMLAVRTNNQNWNLENFSLRLHERAGRFAC